MKMSARNVRHHGYNIIGSFPGLKSMSISYESTVERDLLYFAECDPLVVQIESQPFTIIHETGDGKTHRYTPDYLVIRRHDRGIVECKPASQLESEDTQRQCKIGRLWAAQNDHWFLLVTDEALRDGHRLNNLRILWRYSRYPVEAATTMRCVALLADYPDGLPFLDLATELAQSKASPLAASPVLYALLFQQTLVTDLTQPLGPSSRVYLASSRPSLRPQDLLSLR